MNPVMTTRLLAALATGLLAHCGSPPPEATRIGSEAQLFVGHHLVSHSHGVRRTLHPGRKLGEPVLVADRPWEGERLYVYGTVDYDRAECIVKMWCLARLGPGYETRLPGLGRHGDLVLYATSKDGIRWDKPGLNLHRFDGSGEQQHRPAESFVIMHLTQI